MEKYLMKYDIEGRLYLYVERDRTGKTASLIKLNGGNRLLRYDGTTKERTFTEYDCECSLAHRFQANESWVTVVKKGCDIFEQYEFPKRVSYFSFDRNLSTTLFTVPQVFVSKCTSAIRAEANDSNAEKIQYPHLRIQSSLGNSGLFIGSIIAKLAKNVKEHIRFKESDSSGA